MNHTITVGGLLAFVALGVGGLMFASSVLSLMAASMSDAPSDGGGRAGCIAAVIGLALVVGGILVLVL